MLAGGERMTRYPIKTETSDHRMLPGRARVRHYRAPEAVPLDRPVRRPPSIRIPPARTPAPRRRRRAPVHRPPVVHPMLLERDPAYVERAMPLLQAISDHYYRAEVEGSEHLSDRGSLLVSTHNGGAALPDTLAFLVAFHRRFGAQAPLHGLVHKIVLRLPGFRTAAPSFGALLASQESGEAALKADRPLIVMPGGDLDALKPFRQRHQITFGPRRGFIRLALRNRVPIIPVVSVGAHETFFVLNDGRWLAELSGLKRLMRVKTVPFTFSFPFGLGLAGVPSIPLPSKIKMRILPPIELRERASAADDPAAVERCFEQVRQTMQAGVDELAARRRFPVFG